MFARLAGTLLIVTLGARALIGQQDRSAPPIFRAQVDAVELDAFVTDAQGKPVTDLTIDDFEIVEGGRPQTITAFGLVNLPIERAVRPLYSPTAIEPDVFTNHGPEGRFYVIALDEVAADHALRARRFLRRFIETEFAANDVAALVYVGRGSASHTQDFTSNRRLLLQAVDRFSGGFGGSDGLVADAAGLAAGGSLESRSRMRALRDLVEFMSGLRGRRKAMLYVTSTIGDVFEVLDYNGGVRSLAFDDFHAVVAAATRGNVAIYPIDPAGLSSEGALGDAEQPVAIGGSLQRIQGLRALAEATGGFALVNSNDFPDAFAQIVRENSTYYVLGYTSTNTRRDGRFHRVEVRVKRPGVQVRARSGYVAPLGRPPAPPRAAATKLSPPVSDVLRIPLPNAAVPMAVSAAPYRGSGRDAQVMIAVELGASQLGLVEMADSFNAQIEVAAAAVNAAGRVFRGEFHRATLSLKPDTYQRALESGIRVLGELTLPPGRYQLRVAAGNTSGRAGAVMADLEVPDFTKETLVIGGVAVTSARARDVFTVAPKTPLGTLLPTPPTSAREFTRGDALTLYTEVYSNPRRPAAHTVDLKAELRSDSGRVVSVTSEERSSSELQGRSGGYGFRPVLPLDVDPGLYVVHVEARANVGDHPTVARDIPIRVK
jgi:VWFA-related protein